MRKRCTMFSKKFNFVVFFQCYLILYIKYCHFNFGDFLIFCIKFAEIKTDFNIYKSIKIII